ncbi:MAG: FitA-like ribbon-helix-helix domain-containing protein [Gammaproteobacteria bacterium]
MSTLVVKNLPDELHEKLRCRAKSHHRSVNKETVAMLEETLNAASRPPELPPPIKLKSGHMLTIEEIEAAIAEGQE